MKNMNKVTRFSGFFEEVSHIVFDVFHNVLAFNTNKSLVLRELNSYEKYKISFRETYLIQSFKSECSSFTPSLRCQETCTKNSGTLLKNAENCWHNLENMFYWQEYKNLLDNFYL